MKMPKSGTHAASRNAQVRGTNNTHISRKTPAFSRIIKSENRWMRCFLPLSMMLMSGLATAQDARIECPPSADVSCETDIVLAPPTLFIEDTIRVLSDENEFYGIADTENYEDNPTVTLPGPNISGDASLLGAELRLIFRIEMNSCEEDIDIRLTSPLGDVSEFISPFSGCHSNPLSPLYTFTTMLDISGIAPNNAGEWLIELRDSDDQNLASENLPGFSPNGTDFSLRFVDIHYFSEYSEVTSDFSAELTVNGPPGCPGTTHVYTYQANAPNGDVLSCEQIFTITNDLPTITCPAYTIIASAADIVLGIADVETSCGLDASIEVSNPVIAGEPNAPGTTYTYTYIAMDECGRQATCEQTFKIEDVRLECPPDDFIECEADLIPSAPTLFTKDTTRIALDNDLFYGTMDTENYADNPLLVFAEPDLSDGKLLSGAALRIFVKVENNSCQEDIDIRVTSPSGVVTEFISPIEGCSNNNNALYIFSEMLDVSGVNQGNIGDWLIELRDSDDQNAQSDGQPSPSSPAGTEFSVRFADINYFLEIPETVSDFDTELTVNGQPDCPGTTYTYEYEVVTPGGNTLSCEQTLTIANDPPTITCPAGGMVACAADIIPGMADFETSCELGGSIDMSDPVIVGEADCPGTTYTYIFTGTDDCGRQAACERVFTIANDPPVIVCGEDMDVSCVTEISVAIPAFENSCGLGGNVALDSPVVNGTPNCDGTTYTYTFTGTDDCGRTASCEQVFTIVNNEPPGITCPADATIFCSADIMVNADDVVFTTSCDVDGVVSVSDPVVNGEADCPGTTYTYTYTVEDACGRTASCEQVFTISNVAPIISCPLDAVVACSADISVDPSNIVFVTSCDVEGTVSIDEPVIVGEPDCPGTTYTYTYTVEDVCGRALSCSQTFTIENDAPTITCPADETVACSSDISVDASNAIFTTSCDIAGGVILSGPMIDGAPDCPGTTYTYTYIVEDACGRNASCEQVFTIENDAPTIACPADAIVACSSDIVVNASNAVFTSSCELGTNVSLSDPVINGTADCPGTTYTYTYTIEDTCGRTASCEQVFTIENDPPTITCPADTVVACASDIIPGTADFETSCELGSSVEVTGPMIDGEPDCPGTTYTYTYTGTDACGRQAICERVFTIENDPPVITCLENATVSCAIEIAVAIPVFETSCGLGGNVDVESPVIDGIPDCEGTTYTYTFIGTDDCGRTASCEQVFTIVNDPPTITCPADATVFCSADIMINADDAVFTTSCDVEGEVNISEPVIVGEPDCPGTTYTYTYTVEDICGRTATCEQVFTISNVAPIISCPLDAVVACSADISVDPSNIVFVTSCDVEGTVSIDEPVIVGEPDCPGTTYTYTYTVEDVCGRALSCSQTFTIENDAPTITCPADETVACSSDISVDASNAIFTTSCDIAGGVILSGPMIDGAPDCPGTTYTYTYIVEDACGRNASCEQVFTIENDAPTIACPADAIVACSSDIVVNASNAVFTSSCELGTNVSLSDPVINGTADCPGTTYTYTYTIEDTCGRTASCEQVFTIENDPPTITCPADTVVACASDIIPGTADFETSCELGSSVEVTGPMIDGEPDCPGTTYTYTYTGTDACGRQAICERVFTIENDPPVITCLENATVSCAIEIAVAIPVFETSCGLGGNVDVESPVIDGIPDCEGTTYTYTFIGTDDCGRTASCEQVFTIVNDPPTITCPADATVFCSADIMINADDAVFTTSCDVEGEVNISEPVIVGEPDCPGTTYTYTYTVEDICGRTATCEQVFTISNVAPIISCPLDAVVECSADIVVDSSNVFFATSCDVEGEMSMNGPVIVGEPDCPGTTYTYTYTVEDICGRTLSCDQTFTIENAPPTITCPPNERVVCAEDIMVDASNAVFTTSCDVEGGVIISGPEVVGEPDCPGTRYIYTYIVEDACGRNASCEQVFTVNNDPPTITCPADTLVACSADILVAAENAVFSTSCDVDGGVSVSDPVISGEADCPGTTYTYTYTVEDACGRTASCEQVFTIENDLPMITCPADTMVACAGDIIPGVADFETSCELGASLEVTGPAIIGEPDCPGTRYIYTYTVEDDCGRMTSCEQVFTIENEAPEIVCPEDQTISCASEILVAIPTFSTGCQLGGDVSVEGPVMNGAPNCEGTTYTYTFIGIDDCGREVSCEQVFTIANDPPAISCPAGTTVFCSADIMTDAADAVFTTSCDVEGEVSISEPVVDGEPDCPGTTYTYTYTIEDICGRTGSCEQVFTITNSPPIISCPLDAVIECSADIVVDPSSVFFSTSCDVEGMVNVSEPVIDGEPDCPGTTYTYTYTAEDICGRTLSCDQTFTIENDAPTISCPADETVVCSGDISVDVANVIFKTSCDLEANVSVGDPVIDGEPDCPGTTYTYTYTVEDACGRTASCEQVFTIENESPTISCSANIIVACSADIIPDTSDVMFLTNCDLGANINVEGPVIVGESDCPGTTYTYTYTVEDLCGRTVACERIFTIENNPPMISCGADTIISCASDIIVGTAFIETSCELGASLEVNGPLIVGEPDCSGTTYTYTFTGTDECGREATCERIFTIQNEAPEIICPADKTVSCALEIIVEIPIFNTSCELGGHVEVEGPVVDGAPNCEGTTYTYTFIGTDDCGRMADCSQVFTIENTLTISCPSDTTVICSADIDLDVSNVLFETSCDLEGEVSVSEPVVVGEPDCEGTTYTYTYTVEDVCGRMASCERMFTIANSPPILDCPLDTVVACAADIVIDIASLSFETSCGVGAEVSVSEPEIVGEPDCPGTTYTYTYTVEDACGGTLSCEQVFTIENHAPTISCPADEIVACATDIIVNIENVLFTTSCGGDATVSVSDTVVVGAPDCAGTTYTYTYTVEDICGRATSCEQTFTIENDLPTISCLEDVTVVCAADIVLDVENVSFATSCELGGAVSVSQPEIVGEPDCPNTTYTYTYTVEDACGRTASCERVFLIENSPLIVSCPSNATVSCEADIIVDDLSDSYTTSCDVEGTVILSQLLLDGIPDCAGTTYTYIYTVEDACGRIASCEQIFTIDNEPPTIIACPTDTIIVTNATDIVIDTANIVFTTSCDLGATVSVNEPILEGEPDIPGATYTYTYTVEDVCGRTASCQQVFKLNDEAPEVIGCAADTTVTCAADIIVDIADVSFIPNCNDEVTITIEEPLIIGEPDCPGTAYVYVYIVKTDCGTDTCERVFTIENDAPKIDCPEDKIVTCTADIIAGTPEAFTSCGLNADITISEPALVSGIADCGDAIYEIEYLVKDNCGRIASCIQKFTIINDEPTITCPEGCPVVCVSDIQLGTPEFTTSCGLEAELSVVGPMIEGEPGMDGTRYIYTHIVKDACGRASSCEQVFTIINECTAIDFDFDDAGNALLPGTEISDQYDDFSVATNIFGSCPQLFDTGNPTANDFDVGTPNEQYGGPGIGTGGGSNTESQGNALIFSQNCGVPNETDGELIFTFDCGVTIKTMDLLDIPCDNADIELYDENNNLIEILSLPNSGINGFYQFEVNVSGVYTMIVDLNCGGGITGLTYCKDNTPGANCDAVPVLCYDYNIDHSDCGAGWQTGALSGAVELGNEMADITIADPDNVLDNTQAESTGLLVRSDPNDIDDEVIITYDLSKSSTNVVFDIIDIDLKNTIIGQQEEVCVYATLGNNPMQILPTITVLEGSVVVSGNCAEGGANSADSGQDESILVEFTQCIDKITILYGTGTNSPTDDPDNSKIVIGSNIFSVEQCKEGCQCPEDDDNDGVCNDEDICPGGDDFTDTDGDGTPDFCDDDCADIGDADGDFVCDDVDQCPGFDDNIDENNNGIPDACDVFCDEFVLDFSSPGYNWSGNAAESFTVANQTFDISITDENDILTNSVELTSGLSVRTDPNNINDEVVVRYQLSQVSSTVTFDITDIDYKVNRQQEKVCIYGTLGGDPTQVLPTITSLDGSVAINGNCAEGTASSSASGQDESILVAFTDCIDEVVIVYGSGSLLSPGQDPEDSKIVIGQDLGFTTEVCTNTCPTLRVIADVSKNINLYPNPVYGNANVTVEINTETRGDAQIILTDAFGRIVSNENIQLMNNFTIHEINADPLSAGIYFVQLQTKEWRTDAMKLVVLKP